MAMIACRAFGIVSDVSETVYSIYCSLMDRKSPAMRASSSWYPDAHLHTTLHQSIEREGWDYVSYGLGSTSMRKRPWRAG